MAQVALQGVPNIRKVFIRETESFVPDDSSNNGFKKKTEWMLDTEGVNLLEVQFPPSNPCHA